jgi:hypothetical protein
MPLEDFRAEAARAADAAIAAGVPLRVTGGVAVSLVSPSALQPPLARTYGDIDFVGRSSDTARIEALFRDLGYVADQEFNELHGQRRLFFTDREHAREADVFLDDINACHVLPLKDRLDGPGRTLTPADLLLSKLQVVQTNPKDFQDALALVTDHPLVATDAEDGISLARIEEVCCGDWGWWRTVTGVGTAAAELAERHAAEGRLPAHAGERLRALLEHLESAPKSRRWKLRARVGERLRWHEDPEDLDHSAA